MRSLLVREGFGQYPAINLYLGKLHNLDREDFIAAEYSAFQECVCKTLDKESERKRNVS